MFDWLKKFFDKRVQCNHDQNYNERYFLWHDNTPMVDFECLDCKHHDQGPVITASVTEDWNRVIIVRNGEVWKEY